ncbi:MULTISPECIES: hypothetical protein [Nocardia]|uniref:hypothetical protein n=1 Tax=Nocardia TaxID=1817 RepID=UPI0012F69E07|nr:MULTISPECIES: hypothetical protein [Nocardia]
MRGAPTNIFRTWSLPQLSANLLGSFGTPMGLTHSDLSVELFFPTNEKTRNTRSAATLAPTRKCRITGGSDPVGVSFRLGDPAFECDGERVERGLPSHHPSCLTNTGRVGGTNVGQWLTERA